MGCLMIGGESDGGGGTLGGGDNGEFRYPLVKGDDNRVSDFVYHDTFQFKNSTNVIESRKIGAIWSLGFLRIFKRCKVPLVCKNGLTINNLLVDLKETIEANVSKEMLDIVGFIVGLINNTTFVNVAVFNRWEMCRQVEVVVKMKYGFWMHLRVSFLVLGNLNSHAKFIELLRKENEEDRNAMIDCLRTALTPSALDAYPA
nr:hypothetical protein [Tanacetum cinerariifolium]